MKQPSRQDQFLLDAIDANLAILNGQGEIICTNKAWKEFALENGLPPDFAAGHSQINYLEVCSNATHESSNGAMIAFRGIRAVLDGKKKHFVFEYPCHSPVKLRWFRMHVTPLPSKNSREALVMHYDITKERLDVHLRQKHVLDLCQLLDKMKGLADNIKLKSTDEPVARKLEDLIPQDFPTAEADPFQMLSGRERAILRGLVRGTRQIDLANDLGLSPKSVSTYRSRIFEKLEVNSIPGLLELVGRFGYQKL